MQVALVLEFSHVDRSEQAGQQPALQGGRYAAAPRRLGCDRDLEWRIVEAAVVAEDGDVDAALPQQRPDPADDARNMLILEGYTDPAKEPVIVTETTIPKVEADPLAKALYESYAETGASY